MSVSQGAPDWLSAKVKEIFVLLQVLQNWRHRSYKKLQWHLAEQLLFLACYCESGYITFGGFLRAKLTAHNKLNLFFFSLSERGEVNGMKPQWVESGELQPNDRDSLRKSPRLWILQPSQQSWSSRCKTKQCQLKAPIRKSVIRLLQSYFLLNLGEISNHFSLLVFPPVPIQYRCCVSLRD